MKRSSPFFNQRAAVAKHINGFNMLPFRPHHRDLLQTQMQALPYAKDLTPHPQLGHVWVSWSNAEYVFETRLKPELESIVKEHPMVLPCAAHPLRIGADGESVLAIEERRLFHASLFRDTVIATEDVVEQRRIRLPRCGETGSYFTNEELSSFLQQLRQDHGYSSSMWVGSHFPTLYPAQELRTNREEKHIVPITSRVFIVGKEVQFVDVTTQQPAEAPTGTGGREHHQEAGDDRKSAKKKKVDTKRNKKGEHRKNEAQPSQQMKVVKPVLPPGIKWKPGMDVKGSIVSENPYLLAQTSSGGNKLHWATQDMLEFRKDWVIRRAECVELQHEEEKEATTKKKGKKAAAARSKNTTKKHPLEQEANDWIFCEDPSLSLSSSPLGAYVETYHREFYNQDQFKVPGRMTLKSKSGGPMGF